MNTKDKILIRRKHAIQTSNKTDIVLELTGTFTRKYALKWSPPYTSSGLTRISYELFDLNVPGGYTYEVTLDSTYQTAQIAILFYTLAGREKYQASGTLTQNVDYNDSGWKSSKFTITVPSTIGGSPIVGCRFTMRQSSSNPTISNSFIINKITIRKV